MNIQLKQRLVGAVVLVSLGVIFIPMILPGDGEQSAPGLGEKVPPAPEYAFSPLPEPPAAPVVEEAPPVVEPEAPVTAEALDVGELAAKALPKEKEKIEEKKPAAPAKPESQTKAWVVQVGSFSSDANAGALRNKLRKQGFSSFVEATKGEKGMVYRVRVGPELTRESAEQLQRRLASAVKLNGMVMQYP